MAVAGTWLQYLSAPPASLVFCMRGPGCPVPRPVAASRRQGCSSVVNLLSLLSGCWGEKLIAVCLFELCFYLGWPFGSDVLRVASVVSGPGGGGSPWWCGQGLTQWALVVDPPLGTLYDGGPLAGDKSADCAGGSVVVSRARVNRGRRMRSVPGLN